jgi:hypothetical protein
MLLKVQGAGVYAKDYPLDFDSEPVKKYARQSEILLDFFDSLADYVALDLASGRILESSCKYQYALAAPGELVVYLHRGEYGTASLPGGTLRIETPGLPSGAQTLRALHPGTGKSESVAATVRDEIMVVTVPSYAEDLALHLTRTRTND